MSNSHLRLLDTGFGDSFDTPQRRVAAAPGSHTGAPSIPMRIDVSETPDAYLVKADIPGVKKEDIRVRIDGNMVQIDAEARHEKGTKGEGDKLLHSERHHGSVSRSVSLAQDVDNEHASAKYTDGVLTLELPKKVSAASRHLKIH